MHKTSGGVFILLTLSFIGDAEIAGLDIAGLNISGRVCESEVGNMLRFCYGRPVKTQPTGTRVEKSDELTFTVRNYLIAYLK